MSWLRQALDVPRDSQESTHHRALDAARPTHLPEVEGIPAGASRPGNTAAPCEDRDATFPGEADIGSAGVEPQPAPAGPPQQRVERWAIMRVCMYCKRVIGAKDEATKEPIALGELGQCRMHLQAHNIVTSGVCEGCLATNAMLTWRANAA
jgi:hypothetical protein